jgi:hypothetical protein
MASTTFDLPEPLGPTTQVIPGSSRILVAEAKDLNPFTVRVLRYTNLRCGEWRTDSYPREGTVRAVITLAAAPIHPLSSRGLITLGLVTPGRITITPGRITPAGSP